MLSFSPATLQKNREGESSEFKKKQKRTFPAAGGRGEKNHHAERQVILSSFDRFIILFRITPPHHHHPPLHSSKRPLCAFFPTFLLSPPSFRTAAVNMLRTPDTNQPPLIITGATKQENKYGREGKKEGDGGRQRGSLCRPERCGGAGWTPPETERKQSAGRGGMRSDSFTVQNRKCLKRPQSVSDWFLMGPTQKSTPALIHSLRTVFFLFIS